MEQIANIVQTLGQLAKNAATPLALKSNEEKNYALLSIAKAIEQNRSYIKAQNSVDIELAKEAGLNASMIDRLLLDDSRIDNIIAGINDITKLSDPVGKLITSKTLANGLDLKKVRTPIGVIGVVFESRPNVLVDVATLCLKSGNTVILRGGKEAQHSNMALMKAIEEGLSQASFVPFVVQLIPVLDREAITQLCRLDSLIDLIIPRGGEALIKAVTECATVPVIKHYKGLCHIYVDAAANIDMALNISHNAKCQRPGVCNAVETILVHKDIAEELLPKLHDLFLKEQVVMKGDEKTRSILPTIEEAHDVDWSIEYLDLMVSVKIVDSLSEAVKHINTYGSHHSDAIITEDKASRLRFIKEVDSAVVYVNASTRFSDGAMFGLGAEIGISTDKLHARGPMGLEELTTYKWVMEGKGQIR